MIDLRPDHLHGFCKMGQGRACCRYLVGSAKGLECAKHRPDLAAELDRRVAAKRIGARGDNCPGLAPGTVIPMDPARLQ